jgi:hypothetical protein
VEEVGVGLPDLVQVGVEEERIDPSNLVGAEEDKILGAVLVLPDLVEAGD